MSIVNHADFLAATRDVRMVPKEVLLNEVTKNTYFFFSSMMKGAEKRFKGGTKLVDKIQGESPGTFSFYSPNDEFSPEQVDTLKPIEVNWAFAQSHYVLIKETASLNQGDPNAYLDYVKSLEQGCVVDTVNGMEEALWATPNFNTMETSSADPRVAYSILCFVTKDGEMPSSTNGGVAETTDWTTLESLDVTSNNWFKNKFGTYSLTTPDDPDDGLINAFDDMILQVKFEVPDALRKWSEDEGLQKFVICTNRDGITYYKARLRQVNDRMEMLRDPAIPGVQYQGIPLKYVSQLDSVFTASQPEYLFLNMNFLCPWFHTSMYMDEVITNGGAKQPNSTVVYKFTWYNLLCRSRRRQGRLYGA